MEVIVIYDDEMEVGPAVQDGEAVKRVSPIAASGDDEPGSAVLVIAGQECPFRSEVRVAFTQEGVQIIRDFLGAVMVTLGSGFESTVLDLIGQLRGELRDLTYRVDRSEPWAKSGMTGVTDPVLERYWWAGERAWFGLDAINVIHRFLACVIRPPRGGFSLYLSGIRHKLAAHVRALERDAVRRLRVE